jgi:lipopolysaccharide export LptBFGC system permease protein LptF
VRRRYLRQMVPAMMGYVAAVFVSIWLLGRVEAPALRALIALLPVPGIALAMRAIVLRIRDADELQRRIELEAVSIAAAFVSLGYLAAGFLQRAKVIDVPSSVAMIWVFPLACFSFGIAKILLSRRYR